MKRLTILILFTFAALQGCAASAYESLRPERDIPLLANLLEERPELTTTITPTHGASGPVVNVAVKTEQPSSDRVIVLIHGVLADSRAWRYVTGAISQTGDLVLVDMPGAGLSDAPRPGELREHTDEVYTPRFLARRTAEAIADAIDARDQPPESVAIVAHSLGSLVALRMLTDTTITPDARTWMVKVDRLILISAIDAAIPYGPPSLEKVAFLPSWRVHLGTLTGRLRDAAARAMRRSFVDGDDLPREQVDVLLGILTDPAHREAAQATLKHVIPTVVIDGVYYPDWEPVERILDGYASLREREDLAVLLIAGERDEVAPVAMTYRLAAQLPNVCIVTIARTKHSPHVERPILSARLMTHFIEHAEAPPSITTHATRTFTVCRVDPDPSTSPQQPEGDAPRP